MPEDISFKLDTKKVILAIISLVLAFLLVIISLFSINSTAAAEKGEQDLREIKLDISDLKEATAGLIASQSGGIEPANPEVYKLPYPGILPDHPLYWLKMLRDRIWLWTSRTPEAKTERYILYADKRLAAAEALTAVHKEALASTTLTKAEKYLDKAFTEQNKAGDELVKKHFDQSRQAHSEVLMRLKDQLGDSNQKAWQDAWQINQRLAE